MSSKEEKQKLDLEESQMTPPDELGADEELKTEEREAIEAIKKFTDEDEDDIGEISVKSILGGDFLMSKFMVKQIMFVMFCVLLMILYTGNRYDSQQDAQEVKYNVLTQSSELMNLTRQSNVEKTLRATSDSLLHNSITPPFLIKKGNGGASAEDDAPEEVLVNSQELAAQEEEVEEGVEREVKEEVKNEEVKKEESEKEEVKKETTKTEVQ